MEMVLVLTHYVLFQVAHIVVLVQQVVVQTFTLEDKCQILVHYKTQTNILIEQ